MQEVLIARVEDDSWAAKSGLEAGESDDKVNAGQSIHAQTFTKQLDETTTILSGLKSGVDSFFILKGFDKRT